MLCRIELKTLWAETFASREYITLAVVYYMDNFINSQRELFVWINFWFYWIRIWAWGDCVISDISSYSSGVVRRCLICNVWTDQAGRMLRHSYGLRVYFSAKRICVLPIVLIYNISLCVLRIMVLLHCDDYKTVSTKYRECRLLGQLLWDILMIFL